MSTSDKMTVAQRRLAEHSYELKRTYDQTFGLSKKQFLKLYDIGEIQLSSVFENLLVATRNRMGQPSERVSNNGYDFVKVDLFGKYPLGDMKTCTLQKIGKYRRFRVPDVENKLGNIYIVGYNWIRNDFNYFVVPVNFLPAKLTEIAIPVCPEVGSVSLKSKYRQFEFNTWEEMALKD